MTREREKKPDVVARDVLDRYGEPGVQALTRVVGGHKAMRIQESGDRRRRRAISRAVLREMEQDPTVVLLA